MFSHTKEKPIHSDGFFFGYGCGLEEGGLAEGKAKKCPGDTFLARGRVHGWQAASGTGVDCHPFFVLRVMRSASIARPVSEGSAAGGGGSDPSAVQRSIFSRRL